MLWRPKKIHTRNLITKKNSCGSKIPLPSLPPPPHKFSNGPSLTGRVLVVYLAATELQAVLPADLLPQSKFSRLFLVSKAIKWKTVLPITPERSPEACWYPARHPVFSALASSSFTRREKEEGRKRSNDRSGSQTTQRCFPSPLT